jgi:hypothetical protein
MADATSDMKTKLHIPAIALIISIASCNAPNKDNASDTLAAYLKQDSTLNLSSEELEALSGIQQETKGITAERKRALVYDDTVSKDQEPKLPEGMIAGAFIKSEKKHASYSGAYTTTSSSNNTITGTIADKSKVTIYYRLPDKQTIDLPEATYNLNFNEDVVEGSLSRVLFINTGNKIHLGVIEQGSNKLYTATFKEQNLTIRQLATKDKKNYPVEIQFNNDKFLMNAGDKQTSSDTKFYLQTSIGVEGNPVGLEGQAFFVRVYVY